MVQDMTIRSRPPLLIRASSQRRATQSRRSRALKRAGRHDLDPPPDPPAGGARRRASPPSVVLVRAAAARREEAGEVPWRDRAAREAGLRGPRRGRTIRSGTRNIEKTNRRGHHRARWGVRCSSAVDAMLLARRQEAVELVRGDRAAGDTRLPIGGGVPCVNACATGRVGGGGSGRRWYNNNDAQWRRVWRAVTALALALTLAVAAVARLRTRRPEPVEWVRRCVPAARNARLRTSGHQGRGGARVRPGPPHPPPPAPPRGEPRRIHHIARGDGAGR